MTDGLPKAIIFDLDDTLVQHENPDIAWKRVAKRFAPMAGEVSAAALFESIRERRVWYWSDAERHRAGRLNIVRAMRRIVEAALKKVGIDDPPLANEMACAYLAQRQAAETPFPGAVEMLGHLQEQGVRLALITNGSRDIQRGKVERHGLASYFDLVVIEGELGVGKPDPRVYHHALDRLKALPKETWMVGDRLDWDVAAPQRIGIFGVWIDSAGEGVSEESEVKPDRIIRAVSELL